MTITSFKCDAKKHTAQIKGLGANGNSTERKAYVVDVTDNGEPGTNDVFGIQFGTYSKSGKLVSGDVKVN